MRPRLGGGHVPCDCERGTGENPTPEFYVRQPRSKPISDRCAEVALMRFGRVDRLTDAEALSTLGTVLDEYVTQTEARIAKLERLVQLQLNRYEDSNR